MTSVEPMQVMDDASPSSRWIKKMAQEFWDRQGSDRNQKIPLLRIKDSILQTEEGDRIPNALAIRLLQKADENEDGYLDYHEFMNFAESVSSRSPRRDTFSKAAMTVLPRNERTVEKRSYLQQYSCCPPPIFMILTTLVEVGAFIYYMIDMDRPMGASGPAPTYSPLIYNPYRRYEAWRYLGYALIHSGYMHLINNVIVQGILGVALELVHGAWRLALIYLSGVLFGSLAQSISDPKMYLAGASGGVYAVEYAHLGNLVLNWSQMEYRWIQLIVIGAFSITDLSFAIWDTYFSGQTSNTGHMAHLGGAIAGMTVGIYILRNLEQRKWEKYCWWVALILYLILVGVGITLNATLPVPQYFPEDDFKPIGQARMDFFKRKDL